MDRLILIDQNCGVAMSILVSFLIIAIFLATFFYLLVRVSVGQNKKMRELYDRITSKQVQFPDTGDVVFGPGQTKIAVPFFGVAIFVLLSCVLLNALSNGANIGFVTIVGIGLSAILLPMVGWLMSVLLKSRVTLAEQLEIRSIRTRTIAYADVSSITFGINKAGEFCRIGLQSGESVFITNDIERLHEFIARLCQRCPAAAVKLDLKF